MKILFFSGTHFADCSFPLIRAFTELGHDVTCMMHLDPGRCHRTIINIDHQPPQPGLIPASQYPEMQVFKDYINLDKLIFINHPMRYRDLRTISLALKVRKFVVNGGYDVVISDCLFQFAQVLHYLVRIPWVCVMHDPIPHAGWDTKSDRLKRYMAFAKADKIIIFNQAQADAFCSKYHIKKENLFFNRLSIYDVNRVLVDKKIEVRKNEILFFGNVGKYKGIEYLCEAMKLIHDKMPDAHLTVAGGGKYYFDKSEYEALPYITFVNRFIPKEEMVEMYSRAMVVVCPYIEATQSGVIMSAYAFNKPVVATRVGGLPEMVEDGVTGRLVPPRDPSALADVIFSMLSNNEEYERMTKEIEDVYRNGDKSWCAIAEKYIEIINK